MKTTEYLRQLEARQMDHEILAGIFALVLIAAGVGAVWFVGSIVVRRVRQRRGGKGS